MIDLYYTDNNNVLHNSTRCGSFAGEVSYKHLNEKKIYPNVCDNCMLNYICTWK